MCKNEFYTQKTVSQIEFYTYYVKKLFSWSHNNWSKIVLIALKFGEDVEFVYYLLYEFFGWKNWLINFEDIWGLKFSALFSNRNFSRTALCTNIKFIDNFLCGIDNIGMCEISSRN